MNETAAKEWLTKAWHHYSSAALLYQVQHYTDVIAVDLHYAVEITLKSILAYENKKNLKTHDINELAKLLEENLSFSVDEERLMVVITTYHIKGSYPTPHRNLPPREEIKKVLAFADYLLDHVCTLLKISIDEIRSEPK
ncbi:MAG: HEPN domain-containing protein [Sulfuricurvum sp.]